MSKVRWGLLSTARINRRLIPAIRAARRGELVAVASRSADSAAAYAAEWEIPQSFAGYDAMLESGQVDAVYIGLPNHLHAEWSIRAMEAGVHVLCEKPFAISVAEVDTMMDASRRTGRVLAEAFMYRHHPQTKLVGEYVRQGRLGEISVVRGAFNFDLGGDATNVRMVPEYGGGSLWDVGCYPVSFAQYVMGGTPERVSAMQWLGPTGIDEGFVGQMFYAGARLAQITCSFRTPYFAQAEILGTKGRLVLNSPFIGMDNGRGMFFYPPDGDPEEVEVPVKELYLGEVEDMHRAILDGEPNYLTLDESRDHVRTILALYEAARVGQTVTLP